MKNIFRILPAITLFSCTQVHATVTLNFNSPFLGGVSSNFADADGNVLDGLIWGVIVDNTGNGILGSYEQVVLAQNGRYSLNDASGNASDDTLFISSDFTSDTSAFSEGDFITQGGSGGITGITNMSLTGGVDAADDFHIVWFDDSDLSKAGVLSDPSFELPADGSSEDYDSPFVGNDNIRPADGNSLRFVVVPEPSSTALIGLGGLALLLRRRR